MFASIMAGASGYVLKEIRGSELVDAIRRAGSGQGVLDPAMTNALPVRRMGLAPGVGAAAPAAYVRAVGLAVERLEQTYLRAPDEATRHSSYDYTAPAFGFACRIAYDESGLVLNYPGIAVRTG